MADAPILRTEVYAGALDGDDRDPSNPTSTAVWFGDGYTRYPNAMGSQSGGIYLPGPAALSDDDPSTRIRISSAWAADWVCVCDGSPLASTNTITVEVDVTVVYVDPTDQEQFHEIELSLYDWAGQTNLTGGFFFGFAEAAFVVNAGQSRSITWVIDEEYLNTTHNLDGVGVGNLESRYHWYDTDYAYNENGPHSFAEFRDRMLAAPDSTIGLWMTKGAGGHPYEVDVTRVRIYGDSGEIAGTPIVVRQRFT